MQTSDKPSLPAGPALNGFNVPYAFDAAENADPANWEWSEESRTLWGLACESFQVFKDKWFGAPLDSQHDSVNDNIILSLFPLPNAHRMLPSSIIVRRFYIDMFNLIWTKAMLRRGRQGIIIIGQPGIGKSLFQLYLLVQLLQRKQVVLFSLDGSLFYLFYHDRVYTSRKTVLDAASCPWFPQPKGFIWSLLDIHERKEPPRDLVCLPCLPVQAASPNPVRYAIWQKQYTPLLTGLPLWSRDELAQALPHQKRYTSLLNALSSPNRRDLLAGFPGARALLDERGEDTTSPLPLDALNHLLDAAIGRFGYSARDVFNGVFDYTSTTLEHEKAFQITYADLQAAISAFSKGEMITPNVANRILVISPCYNQDILCPPTWTVNFKSDWVAKRVIQQLSNEAEAVICEQISLLQYNPQTAAMAGWYFEPLAHRLLVRTSSDSDFWPLVKMVSDGADPPRFVMASNPSSVPDNVQFAKVKRNVVHFQSIADLPEQLENKTYYIPLAQNFPLVDAFAVDLDPLKKSAILWVLQVTISPSHRDSAAGYQSIRGLIAHLKNQLRGRDPPPTKKVKVAEALLGLQVRYLLVVPNINGPSQAQNLSWQFPMGWNENCTVNDHRGDVYRLEIPLAGT